MPKQSKAIEENTIGWASERVKTYERNGKWFWMCEHCGAEHESHDAKHTFEKITPIHRKSEVT